MCIYFHQAYKSKMEVSLVAELELSFYTVIFFLQNMHFLWTSPYTFYVSGLNESNWPKAFH